MIIHFEIPAAAIEFFCHFVAIACVFVSGCITEEKYPRESLGAFIFFIVGIIMTVVGVHQ